MDRSRSRFPTLMSRSVRPEAEVPLLSTRLRLVAVELFLVGEVTHEELGGVAEEGVMLGVAESGVMLGGAVGRSVTSSKSLWPVAICLPLSLLCAEQVVSMGGQLRNFRFSSRTSFLRFSIVDGLSDSVVF